MPDGWESLNLGELAEIRRGASPRPIKDEKWFSPEGRGWIRISDVSKSNKYLRRTTQYLSNEGVAKSVKVNPGDLIMSICGTIGTPIILDMEACIHDGFVFFDKLSSKTSAEFMYYFLQLKSKEFESKGQPGAQKNLNTSIVKATDLFLPPALEQKKIAEILSSVDDAIQKTQQVIDQTQKVKKGLLQELMTKGIGHTKFKKTEVGEIPVSWAVHPVSAVCSDIIDCKNRTPPKSENGHPVIKTPNVREGRLLFSNITYTDEKSYIEWTKKGVPKANDIVLTREAPIGEACIIPDGISPCLGQRTMLYRFDQSVNNPKFFLFQFLSDLVQEQLMRSSGGSTVGHVRVGDMKSFAVVRPPLEEQREIVRAIESVESLLLVIESQHTRLTQLKSGLMQDLLTGKVRVKT